MTQEEIQAMLEKKFEDVQGKLIDLQKSGATKDELQKVHDEIKDVGTSLQDFMDEQKNKVVKGFMGQFKSFLTKNEKEIEDIFRKGSGTIEFIPKAVGDITTGSGTDIDTPPLHVSTQLGSFNLRDDSNMLSLCTILETDQPQYSYTEMLPKEGGYAFVAEGNTKPQTDFKWENRYETPKKAAAYQILSEESVTDYKLMMSVAKEYLKKQHDLFKVSEIYFADGTGIKPTGATVYGRTFVAGAMASAVTSPNFMDIVNAIITDIFVTQNYTDEAHYQANVVLVHPIDFYLQLVSAKDDNGLPLYPQASLFNQVNFGGVVVRPWIKVPAGKIFVADMKRYTVVNYVPFSIRIGWINDQFITNKFTIVGESRYFQYLRNLDQNAFVYDDIATVSAAIAV